VAFEKQVQTKTVVITVPGAGERPETPDYELFEAPFGEGAYGTVWLAKNAVGQWQALKTVYLARFGSHPEPYDREFNGIRRYKPISDKHRGLLRVDFVSMKKEGGYFYYVMELGDSVEPGWEQNPSAYRPRDLASVRAQSEHKRLPLPECVRIGVVLTDALEFLHRQALTHRDIKPRNILFVKNQPKLADVGLVADIRPSDADFTLVGTPGYMPPSPEPPGTVQADIYGLGMVLYVILTGREPDAFPEVTTALVEKTPAQDFIQLNAVILKACQPDRAKRYASAAEMHADLLVIHKRFRQADLTANI
jgi:serine/threonine protein kinase